MIAHSCLLSIESHYFLIYYKCSRTKLQFYILAIPKKAVCYVCSVFNVIPTYFINLLLLLLSLLSYGFSTGSSYCRHIPHERVTASSQGPRVWFSTYMSKTFLSNLTVPKKTDFCAISTPTVIPSMSTHLLKPLLIHLIASHLIIITKCFTCKIWLFLLP